MCNVDTITQNQRTSGVNGETHRIKLLAFWAQLICANTRYLTVDATDITVDSTLITVDTIIR